MEESMKSLLRKKIHATYIVSSPWLLAAAAALLVFIIATFALHNYRLEKRLMRDALEQRAVTLVQMLHSGIRVALINELRQHRQLSSGWSEQLQQVVSHVSDGSDVVFLGLADGNGRILAHSDREKVGSRHLIPQPVGREAEGKDVPPAYRIHTEAGADHTFTLSTLFTVLSPEWGGRGMGRHHQGPRRQRMMPSPGQGFERHTPMPAQGPPAAIGRQTFQVFVGLDMRDYEKALNRLKWQILLLSVAMLLVGLGGWLSLAAVQGYRVSQKTVERVQAYTALLVAQLPLGLIATTPEGRIETWNAAMAGLTGRSAQEALGRLPREVLPAVLADFFEDTADPDSTQTPPVRAAQSLTLQMAGERRVLYCQPLHITDALQGYRGRVLLLSDITERSDLELRMRENERLAAIGRMAGGVAHEVRNPLSSIKGLAFLLKNTFSAGSREEESAALLVQETERLNRTISQMLDLTRPSQLRLEAIDMGELLGQSLLLMQTEFAERGIDAQLHCTGSCLVQGDADRLRQVLMNVLLNAQQAMEDGGCLTVHTTPSADGQWLDILVTDTGRGIAPELLPQVFFPYVTTREGGSGIGLAISQKIVAEHQGSMDIQSEPGQGTSVRIRLPRRQERNASG